MSHRLRTGIYLAAIALLAVLFFSDFIFGGKAYLATGLISNDPVFGGMLPDEKWNYQLGDIIAYGYPADFFYNRMCHQGRTWLWNPHSMCGFPVVPDARAGLFYPVKMLAHRLLPVEKAHGLLIFIHTLVAGIAMFFLARSFQCSPCASLLAAVIWMFSGLATGWLEYGDIANVNAYFPLAFLFFRKSIMEQKARYAVITGMILGVYQLVALLQYSLYFALFFFAYGLFMVFTGSTSLRRCALSFLLTGLFAFGVSAVQTLLSVEMLRYTQREAFTWNEVFQLYSAPLWTFLLTFLCPQALGNPALGLHFFARGSMMYHETCWYIGILSIPFAVAGILSCRARERLFFAFAALCALLWAGCTIFYYPVFTFLPLFNKMIPGRFIYLALFCLCILAASGFHRYFEEKEARKPVTSTVIILLAFYGICFATVLLFQAIPGLFIPLLKWGFPRVQYSFTCGRGPEMYLEYMKAIASYYSPMNLWLFLPAIILAAGALVLRAFQRGSLQVKLASHLALFLVMADLGLSGILYIPVTERKAPEPTPPLRYLMAQQGPFRVLNLASPDPNNLFQVFSIDDAGGGQSLYPSWFQQLMSTVESGFRAQERVIFGNVVKMTGYQSPVFSMLNVRYFILEKPLPGPDSTLREVLRDRVVIYENLAALPRAYLVKGFRVDSREAILNRVSSKDFSPEETACLEHEPHFSADTPAAEEGTGTSIEEYAPDIVTITAHCSEKSILFISQVFYPGWEAAVDGRPAEVLKANYAFQAVALGKGSHRVVLSFRPTLFKKGILITVATSLTGLLLLLLAPRGERPQKSPLQPKGENSSSSEEKEEVKVEKAGGEKAEPQQQEP
ncbi:MAG: YfhO family protein [Candidatus Eremiobacteraeota bacterium]|nr:YfhO family protein [Candidatus Eremiobacteraeota bacterium]